MSKNNRRLVIGPQEDLFDYPKVFVSSKHSINKILKFIKDYQDVPTAQRVTDYSVHIANLNLRKAKMLLGVKGYEKPQIKKQNGRVSFSGELRHYLFRQSNYRCVECGLTNKETSLHIDHILPLSRGGTNDLENLQVLCKDCNLSKHVNYWEGGK